ncbi:MAG: PCRF domain-containing protein, partial [Pseudomonadales bacterium]|nr:PCRF domain-containing protein [Pseudomonadales bacterium]
MEEVELELAQPGVWDDPEKAQALGRERATLEAVVAVLERLQSGLSDAADLFELAVEESDEDTLDVLRADLDAHEQEVHRLEFRRMFAGEMDASDCFVDIQAGSGGTEAQDWAEMLLRMYLRWAERRGFDTEIIELSPGEVAGIKGATFLVRGDHAFGWMRTETGIHRLVRKSPFDAGARRHTSFASVFVSPEIDDDIEIEIDP